MIKNLQTCVLLVPAHPALYPHAQRHAQICAELWGFVQVSAVFSKGDLLPQMAGVNWHSARPNMPNGVGDFGRLAWCWWRFLRKSAPNRIEAIDPIALLPAAVYSLFFKVRILYFSMELFPELPSLRNKPLRRWIWKILEFLCANRATVICTVNTSVARQLSHNLGRNNIRIVRNIPPQMQRNSSNFRKDLRSYLGLHPDAFILLYQGKLEVGRGLEAVSNWLRTCPNIHFVILGYGPLETRLKEMCDNQPNLHFGGAHAFSELMELSAQANAGLAWIEPLARSYELSLPGKIFEYIQNQLPVLISPLPEMVKILQQYSVGEVAQTMNETGFLEALKRLQEGLLENRYKDSLQLAAEQLCWEREGEELRKALQELDELS